MIQIKELCSIYDYIPEDHKLHLSHLHYALNSIRSHYKKPMVVTSGYRTANEQQAIYAKRNEARAFKGLPPLPVPMQSLHCIGAAADILDTTGEFAAFIQDNPALYQRLDVYFEDFTVTKPGTPQGWIHIALFPPLSQKRFFFP